MEGTLRAFTNRVLSMVRVVSVLQMVELIKEHGKMAKCKANSLILTQRVNKNMVFGKTAKDRSGLTIKKFL